MLQTDTTTPAPPVLQFEQLDSRNLNLQGQKHGQLTVLNIARSTKKPGSDRVTYWNVSCSCGVTLQLTARAFKKHQACRSCQHIQSIQESFKPSPQQKFTLTGYSHYKESATGAQGQYIWDCRCDCGKDFKLSSKHLKSTLNCPDCSLRKVSELMTGRRSSKRKYLRTPQVINLLTECYRYQGSDLNKHQKAPTLITISQQTGWHPSALRDLATELGFSKTLARPLRPWTQEELATLTRMQKATFSRIKDTLHKEKFSRSRNEIRDKLIELSHSKHADRYTLKEILSLLGLKYHQKLPALLRSVNKTDSSASKQTFTRDEIKSFLLSLPSEYQLASIDKVFFTMLVLKESFTPSLEKQP